MSKKQLTKAEHDAVMLLQPEISRLVERAHAAGVSHKWFANVVRIHYQAIHAMTPAPDCRRKG